MSHVLIVEDEAHLAKGLQFNLEAEGHSVAVVGDGERALDLLLGQSGERAEFDAVVLDVMLPGKDGFTVARELRAAKQYVPVLMLTARGRPEDVLKGFASGADDYLPKPFESRELVARVRALLRRAAPGRAESPLLRFEGLVIDLLRREVRVGEQALALTSVEFKLLVALARTPGTALSREALSDAVQAGAYRPQDRTVDVQVARLRRKLQEVHPGADWIDTVRGEGYVFVPR